MNQDRGIVIIGCGAGGGTAAQFARKTDRKSGVAVFEQGKYPQYSKCGLPYTISGVIPEFNDLIEFSKEWFKKARIDLFLETRVEEIDVNNQVVIAKKGNKIVEKPYGSLIIATGAWPSIPPIKNIQENDMLVDGVHVLRTIDDAEKISSDLGRGKRATVVGAGLVGLEMADCLHRKGMDVTVVEALPFILANTLDEDMVDIVHEEVSKNVNLFTNSFATKIRTRNGRLNQVFIKNNETGVERGIDADLLIIATGCKPDVSLAKNAGCKIGGTGGIIVNEKSETSMKNIYAVGDCTEYKDFVTQEPVLIGLGSIAVRQGIAAGTNAAGGNYKLPQGVLLSRTSEFFGIEIAAVGPTMNSMKNISVISGKFNGSSLPEYYPGGKPIAVKVIVQEEAGRIVAAQAVGDNAAQRINTFACAVVNNMDVETFRKLETAYAPSIAPTLDAVTLACDVVSLKLGRKKR